MAEEKAATGARSAARSSWRPSGTSRHRQEHRRRRPRCNSYEVVDWVMVSCDDPGHRGRREGRPGRALRLITPSLDEWPRRERDGAPRAPLPLLIGGATTSREHTAVKIAPAYGRHDGARARRVAPVASSRRSSIRSGGALRRREPDRAGARPRAPQAKAARPLVPFRRRDRAPAGARMAARGRHGARVLGRRVLDPFPPEAGAVHRLAVLFWPGSCRPSSRGARHRRTRGGARSLRAQPGRSSTASSPRGLLTRVRLRLLAGPRGRRRRRPYRDESRTVEAAVPMLRRQAARAIPLLADWVAPRESGVPDYVGFAVTAASRRRAPPASSRARRLLGHHREGRSPTGWRRRSRSCWHERARREWATSRGRGSTSRRSARAVSRDPSGVRFRVPDHTRRDALLAARGRRRRYHAH